MCAVLPTGDGLVPRLPDGLPAVKPQAWRMRRCLRATRQHAEESSAH